MAYNLPTTGTNPKVATKAGLEALIDTAIGSVAMPAVTGFPYFPSVELGLAGTVDEGGFCTAVGFQLVFYRNDDGVATKLVEMGTPLTQQQIDELQANYATIAAAAPQVAEDAEATASDRLQTGLDLVATQAARDIAISASRFDKIVDDATERDALSVASGYRVFMRSDRHLWEYNGATWVDEGPDPTENKLDRDVAGITADDLVYNQFAPRYLVKSDVELVGQEYTIVRRFTPSAPRVFGTVYCVIVVDMEGNDPATAFHRNRLQFQRTSDSAFGVKALTHYATRDDGLDVFKVEWDFSTSSVEFNWIEYQCQMGAGQTATVKQVFMTENALPNATDLGFTAESIGAVTEAQATTIAQEEVAAAIAALEIMSGRAVSSDPLGALAAASWRPIAVLMGADSNGLHQGSGYRRGFEAKLFDRFGAIAAPLDKSAGGPAGTTTTGAPAELEDIGTIYNYSYLEAGSISASTISGPLVRGDDSSASFKIDVTSDLRFHFLYGTFPTGSGSFKPSIRRADAGFNTYVSSDVIPTNTGEYSIQSGTLDLAANAGRAGVSLNLRWNHFTNDAGLTDYRINAPFIGYQVYVEDTAKTAGVIFGMDYSDAGKSTHDMVLAIRGRNAARQAKTYDTYRQLQIDRGYNPIMTFLICHGLNDRNKAGLTSLGPRQDTDSDGPLSFLDNSYAYIRDKMDFWVAQGWDTDELRFIVMPSHPVSDPDDAELISYRAAVKELNSMPFVRTVDMTAFPMLLNFEEINGGPEPVDAVSGGYFNGEREHLRYEWHREIAKRLIDLAV